MCSPYHQSWLVIFYSYLVRRKKINKKCICFWMHVPRTDVYLPNTESKKRMLNANRNWYKTKQHNNVHHFHSIKFHFELNIVHELWLWKMSIKNGMFPMEPKNQSMNDGDCDFLALTVYWWSFSIRTSCNCNSRKIVQSIPHSVFPILSWFVVFLCVAITTDFISAWTNTL